MKDVAAGESDPSRAGARKLGFRHPKTGKWLEFTSEPPEDFAVALTALRARVAGLLRPR